MTWTAAELVEIVNGELHAEPDTVVTGIATDSRSVREGDAFIAIVGEQFNGVAFALDAMGSGAAIVIAKQRLDQPCIVVPDTTIALGLIARAHLRTLPRTRVIAITGSSGKTSTKDLVAQVLASGGNTLAPAGNFNNEIGLPRTVLQANSQTEFLVLEMGMRGAGQIAHLCTVAPPDIAVVLNVGLAHAGVIGSRDDTAAGKGEIIRALHSDGVAVVNRDDGYAHYFESLASCPTLDFGFDEGFVHASGILLDDLARASFTLHIGDDTGFVHLQLLGEHHVGNALAVAAIGHACGLDVRAIAAALSAATARSHGRMECIELDNGVTLIDDSYNANPESMRSALRALAMIGRHRRTWPCWGRCGNSVSSNSRSMTRSGAWPFASTSHIWSLWGIWARSCRSRRPTKARGVTKRRMWRTQSRLPSTCWRVGSLEMLCWSRLPVLSAWSAWRRRCDTLARGRIEPCASSSLPAR